MKMEDKHLIRIKDIVLLIIAISSFVSMGFGFFRKPFELEQKLEQLKKETNGRAEKYVPIVERHIEQIAVIMTQYQAIIARLDKIDRKMER